MYKNTYSGVVHESFINTYLTNSSEKGCSKEFSAIRWEKPWVLLYWTAISHTRNHTITLILQLQDAGLEEN